MILVSEMKLDVASISSAFLHDTVEDTCTTIEEIKEKFGEEISSIVDGVTKLSSLEFGDTSIREAENYRKMVLAMSKDIRVILIKLADRLHNMRTLEYLSPEKQRKISQETRDIYAPLANRLGLGKMKGELEDLCLLYLEPKIYHEIQEKISSRKEERIVAVQEATSKIKEKLAQEGIIAKISGRPKRFCSIYQKMTKKRLSFIEVMDLIGARIITKTVSDCYAALGIIHSMWKPIPGEFDDYIAVPKPNMYQSLHTAVMWREDFHPLEIQIRTEEMHRIAEDGIAAHWKYKEGEKFKPDLEKKFYWLRQLTEMGKHLEDSKEFMKFLKINLFPNDVYVFSPNGDVIELPKGSSPIDFAYSIHTDIGAKCAGAKINGRIVQLKYQLKTGDICEILTSPHQKPNRNWLKLAKTSKAISEIKRKLKKEQSERSFSFGSEICEKGMKRYNLNFKKLEKSGKLLEIAQLIGFGTLEEMLMSVGYGKVSVKQIIEKLIPPEEVIRKEIKRLNHPQKKIKKSECIKVKGMDDVMIRFAKCCTPIPGDDIVGFITRGRGATIHRSNCNSTMTLEANPERKVDVSWDTSEEFIVPVKITVISGNRTGLLADVTSTIAKNKSNILNAQIKVSTEGHATHKFSIEVKQLKQLEKTVRDIRSIEGVFSVERDTR